MASVFSGTPQTATSYTTSTTETPTWMQDAIYTQVQLASNLAAQPYQAYDKPLVAGLTPQQKQAYEQVGQNVGQWQQPYQQATTGTQNLTNTTSVGNVQDYMNPYTQNVTDRIAQLGARNLSENLLPGVSDAFIKAGSFGGTRMGEFGNRALRDTQESILGQQGQALQQGYTQALGASSADLNRQQSALQQLATMAGQGQQMRTSDTAALEAAGSAQQQLAQKEADAAYQQYQNAQLYPRQMADWLSTQVRGMAPITPTTTTNAGSTTGATYSASPLSQLASAGATGLGLYKMANG
jgi:hypothetical protein